MNMIFPCCRWKLPHQSYFLPCIFLSLIFTSPAKALVIAGAGSYTIDTNVGVIELTNSRDWNTQINVVSGGNVSSIRGVDPYQSYRLDVSGNGVVGSIANGMELNVTLRDHAVMGRMYTDHGGSFTIKDNAELGELNWYEGIRFDMSGGYVGTIRSGFIGDRMIGTISQGTIGSFGSFSTSARITMSGGRIMDGLYLNEGYLDLKGGDIFGGVRIDKTYDTGYTDNIITQGHINTTSNEYLLYTDSNFLINGGSIGNIDAGLGFYLYGGSTFNIRGYDLALVDGLLSGYLLDHSRISVRVNFSENWTGSFNLHNVPEPTSFALLSLGLVTISFACRKVV